MSRIQPHISTWGNICGPVAPHLQPTITLLERLLQPGEHIELRVIDPYNEQRRPDFLANGFFNDPVLFGVAVMRYEGQLVDIRFTPNPLIPYVLTTRPANQLKSPFLATVSNGEIMRRNSLFLRFVPIYGVKGATGNLSLRMAFDQANACRRLLTEKGWPDAALADGGDSIDLIYALDLPNTGTSRSLIQQGLEALANTFNTDAVRIDTSLINAASGYRLYGAKTTFTVRPSAILDVPEQLKPVDVSLMTTLTDQLSSLAVVVPRPEAASLATDTSDPTSGDEVAPTIHPNRSKVLPAAEKSTFEPINAVAPIEDGSDTDKDANGLHQFVAEECTLDERVWTPTNRLYEEYEAFCDLYGYSAVTVAAFGKMITARFDLFPERHKYSGVTVRGIRGIRLGGSDDPIRK